MRDALVHIAGRRTPLPIRVNGREPTFLLGSGRISARALAPIEPVLQDLLDIACTVFAADSSVRRGGETRHHMGKAWRRNFRFEIPVRCPEIWARPDVYEALCNAVSFMTEDDVDFEFVEMTASDRVAQDRQGVLDLDPTGVAFEADEVVLFSGGLDSFAGALETLCTTAGKVILLSHRSAQKVIPRQDKLSEYLVDRFKGRVRYLPITARRTGAPGVDTTQRSRSLLFAALGQAVARTFGAKRLGLFENGIIGCNLPISPQVVGTMATRTTHPLAIARLNHVLDLALEKPLPLVNRYEWLTKTEVVDRVKQYDGLQMLSRAVSCTSVREQTTLHTHCGACIQCLDRRFAVLAAGVEDADPPEHYQTDVITGARAGDRSRVMAVEWVRHAISIKRMDEAAFFRTFGNDLMRLVRGHPDGKVADVIARLLDLHRRQARTVGAVLEREVARHAKELAVQRLPVSSLLRLHIGQGTDLNALAAADRWVAPPETLDAVADDALAGKPDGPLVAAFLEVDGRPVVAVDGLGRVEGQPAVPAHFLKPAFDEDSRAALRPAEHRHVRELPPGMSNATMRKNVQRCRTMLAEFYRDIHGSAPEGDLLIEGRQNRGYRLDPTLRIAKSKDT